MGGRSLVSAGIILLALAFPALALDNYQEVARPDPETREFYLNTTYERDKVQKNVQSGDDIFIQEADRAKPTKHYRLETWTTYDVTWTEQEKYTEKVWGVIGQEWVYPCPGPGFLRDIYGWKDEERERTVTKKDVVTRKTGDGDDHRAQPEEIGAYRTVSRLTGGIGGSGGFAGGIGSGTAGGIQVGFSGDSGAGAESARSASAGKAQQLSGASKGTRAGGAKIPDLTGSWSGGLTIERKGGSHRYTLRIGGTALDAEYDWKSSQLRSDSEKKGPRAVDLTVDSEGTTLSGSITAGGQTLTGPFRRQ